MTEVIEKKKFNAYDSRDIVRCEKVLRASGDYSSIKMAVYRVYDPETQKHGKLQFHFTTGDTVCAVMGEEAAKLFARFVTEVLENKDSYTRD